MTNKTFWKAIGIFALFLVVQQLVGTMIGVGHYIMTSGMMDRVMADPELAQDQQALMQLVSGEMLKPAFQVSLAGVGLVWGSLLFIIGMRLSRLTAPAAHPVTWQSVVWGALFIVPMSVLGAASLELLGVEDINEQLIRNVLTSPWGIASVAVLGPIAEEVCFRGGMLGAFMRRARETGDSAAVISGLVLTSALFGCMHAPNPTQVIYATLMGALLGWVYVRTGTLWPCIVMHILNNSLSVVLAISSPQDAAVIDLLGGLLPTLCVCFVCLWLIWLLLTRFSYFPPEENSNINYR